MLLVLSLFPGADLLGMGFELEGFCVVRGPDVLLGGDVRGWHVPAGKFDGVIGGPPCKQFSQAIASRGGAHAATQDNLIPEYERLVREAAPRLFWVMENVPEAPCPELPDCPRASARPLAHHHRHRAQMLAGLERPHHAATRRAQGGAAAYSRRDARGNGGAAWV
jgi:hypothetical protein